jgi:hypothetical protein
VSGGHPSRIRPPPGRRLKIQLVKLGVLGLQHQAGRICRTTRPERDAKADDRAEAIRTQTRCLPGYARTPIVSDHGRAWCIKRVQQSYKIPD